VRLKVLLILALVAAGSSLYAQGESRVEINLRGTGGTYTCYANACFDPLESKQRKIEQLKSAERLRCSNATFGSREKCVEAREEVVAAQQCFEALCSKAVCERRDLTNNRCVSGARFRR